MAVPPPVLGFMDLIWGTSTPALPPQDSTAERKAAAKTPPKAMKLHPVPPATSPATRRVWKSLLRSVEFEIVEDVPKMIELDFALTPDSDDEDLDYDVETIPNTTPQRPVLDDLGEIDYDDDDSYHHHKHHYDDEAETAEAEREHQKQRSHVVPLMAPLEVEEQGEGEEPEEDYRTGGYLRVEMGSCLKHRYRVRRKLGWGVYSTVWVVQDEVNGKEVALKVQKGGEDYAAAAENEVAILRRLASRDAEGVVRLLDSFEVVGENGRHTCMCFELLGSTLLDTLQERAEPFSFAQARDIVRDLLEALSSVHAIGVVHADVKPENIILAPRLKLIDFGAAFDEDTVHAAPIQARHYRSPESILCHRNARFSAAADMWSVGCVCFEVVTGSMLFDPLAEERFVGVSADESHLAQATELLGELPEAMVADSEYFFKGRLRFSVSAAPENMDVLAFLLEETFGLDAAGTAEFSEFLHPLLAYDPRMRSSAAKLLTSKWLAQKNDRDSSKNDDDEQPRRASR